MTDEEMEFLVETGNKFVHVAPRPRLLLTLKLYVSGLQFSATWKSFRSDFFARVPVDSDFWRNYDRRIMIMRARVLFFCVGEHKLMNLQCSKQINRV